MYVKNIGFDIIVRNLFIRLKKKNNLHLAEKTSW